MPIVETSLVITNKVGLHARPASVLVQTAACFQSKIQALYGEKTANAKSILGVLKLGATVGAIIIVRAEGEDAEQAIAALTDLASRNFDEEE
ncbi:MAG TPA: HPr family phosphocarrier protein [Ktedonobacteraceae bacterium]